MRNLLGARSSEWILSLETNLSLARSLSRNCASVGAAAGASRAEASPDGKETPEAGGAGAVFDDAVAADGCGDSLTAVLAAVWRGVLMSSDLKNRHGAKRPATVLTALRITSAR